MTPIHEPFRALKQPIVTDFLDQHLPLITIKSDFNSTARNAEQFAVAASIHAILSGVIEQ